MGFWKRLRSAVTQGAARRDAVRPPLDEAAEARSLESVQAKLQYTFQDLQLLRLALVHRSHTHYQGGGRLESNERLEFLGDSVLGLVVNTYLYRHYPRLEEGDLTKMKSKLVCGENLSRVAGRFELGEHILMSRGEAATGGRRPARNLADPVGALKRAGARPPGGAGAAPAFWPTPWRPSSERSTWTAASPPPPKCSNCGCSTTPTRT